MARYSVTIAHQAAQALAEAKTEPEFLTVLETFEIEPLDALHAFLGSYIEDRLRRAGYGSMDDLCNHLEKPF